MPSRICRCPAAMRSRRTCCCVCRKLPTQSPAPKFGKCKYPHTQTVKQKQRLTGLEKEEGTEWGREPLCLKDDGSGGQGARAFNKRAIFLLRWYIVEPRVV